MSETLKDDLSDLPVDGVNFRIVVNRAAYPVDCGGGIVLQPGEQAFFSEKEYALLPEALRGGKG